MEHVPNEDGTNAGAGARALGLGEAGGGSAGGDSGQDVATVARRAVERARRKAEQANLDLRAAERHYLLIEADAETRAMFERLCAYRQLVKQCPHRDGWRLYPPGYAQCLACGLVATEAEHDRLSVWPAPKAP